MYPIGALDVYNIVPFGINFVLLFEKPESVISILPLEMNFDLFSDKSFGVNHAIPLSV